MSLFLQFEGASPWPDFRCLQLLHSCQQASDNLATLEITTLYVVALNSELAATQQQRLADLLNAKPATGSDDEDIWLVAPRLGTGSPWGDKATQMLHHCGFEEAHRIEAVKRFHLGWHHRPKAAAKADIAVLLHDPMTESVLRGDFNPQQLFASTQAPEQHHIPLLEEGAAAIANASYDLQLNLAPDDQKMLVETFTRRLRNPTEVELMTFAQINSEHCRHRTFRTAWRNQGEPMPASLFDLIRSTWSAVDGAGVLVAYSDNAAVLEGVSIDRFGIHPNQQCYRYQQEQVPILIKVETHNHPTAISPFSGAATGAGGEIRDEGAVGRGSKPKAGLTGFTLSHLHLPDNAAPWELDANHPPNVATPLQIILEAPIGSAAYNNEFGRPNLLGYFRTFEQHLLRGTTDLDRVRGYHKPVMLAGGLGSVRPGHVKSLPAQPGNLLIVLGGPAMLIGMGGSTASSQVAGSGDVAYDFASVQRANPEMQRRCQEVIDSCTVLGEENPIQRIHDVGAGGLSNAMPELVNDGGTGARIDLDAVPVAQAGLSPAQIWCNESQERYVLRVAIDKLWDFTHICRRERCPFAVLGETTAGNQLEVTVGAGQNQSTCLDLPLTTLFGDVILPDRNYQPIALVPTPLPSKTPPLADIARQVLAFPAVAAKMFLITIGDRSITGLIARDQLVGPWQLPVADVAVTLRGYRTLAGEAMAIGERPQLALLNPAAAARMTLAESLTNLASADVSRLSDVKVSANWMAAVDHPGEAARLRDAVVALSECCIDLGVCVPVGKDSLSMQINWEDKNDTAHQVTSPVTLNVTAFAPITNAALTLTPELKPNQDSHLVFIDLADGKCRLGGSVYAQVQQALGGVVDCPDLEEQTKLGAFFALLDSYRSRLLAYHDRSDGGLLVTLAEMAFAGHSGLRIELPPDVDPVAWLFNEELGAVVQVANADLADFRRQAENLKVRIQPIGRPDPSRSFVFTQDQQDILNADFGNWLECWWSLSHQIQKLRDHPDCADAELAAVLDETRGLSAKLGFDPEASISQHRHGRRPKVAILREQGVNGQLEMAAAFYEAGFDPIDVHMSDLAAGRTKLDDHQLLALCGGFSYGDVLGAGVGWARSILYNPELRAMFGDWFERPDRLTLGVCNGCQMLSELRDIIPGTEHWPRFLRNRSEQFEARLSLVRVADNTSSAFLDGMGGSILPVAVAHGEGQAVFTAKIDAESLPTELIALQYTDHDHNITEAYPYNPNGSVQGIAGLTTPSGRLIAMMPHPERVFRTIQHSWHPPSWGPTAPWLRLFRNARIWLNQA